SGFSDLPVTPPQALLGHTPLEGFKPILTEERFILEGHQRHPPMTGMLLRGLIFGDNGLVADGVHFNIAIEFGKSETTTRDSLGQVVAEMPISRAAENGPADFPQ